MQLNCGVKLQVESITKYFKFANWALGKMLLKLFYKEGIQHCVWVKLTH